jgi:hypothetical protein
MAKFFENSLQEIERRNPGIEGNFRRIDANRFTAAVYRNGAVISRCTVFIGGGSAAVLRILPARAARATH